ncbi:MBL fold metallo-hydrolase [Dictyobacter sp. S3.2.2.5]|uniref:MBL fold metallo-hydrolase n=1 Tax=Dictyobacter halimunensis TaxID=3026934 RepID=A0ABQ6FWX7_9CHLR|nr:MBL fold metallo-hydrolase [Dictyobacter sp. S3.2.2.5]
MKVRSHGEHLFQLSHLGFVNCYLVREEDDFTLVDTAMSGCGKSIVQAAQQLGSPIVRILLTHAHVDHVGALDELHELLPDAKVLITSRSARFLAGDMSLDPDEPQDKLRGGWPPCKTRPSRVLEEGDYVGSLRVIATPGHTPGHASFIDTRDKTLIAGDAFQTLGGVAVSGKLQPLFPLPALATWHKPTSLESARKLRTLEPTRLAVGHGRVLERPLAAMDRAIDALTRELARKAQR